MGKNILKAFGVGFIIMNPCFCLGIDEIENRNISPNIIFILADDLGYGDLGCYGQKMITTPEIDRMASEGMKFNAHYSGSTVCAPSRCSLMTGLHSGHSYIRNNAGIPLRQSDITISTLLKESGYSTALIGKWGLGNPGTTGVPTLKGFDYFFGYMDQGHAHNYYPTFLYRNEEKVMLDNIVPEEELSGKGVATEKITYSHDLFTLEAIQYIETHHSQSTPFFLFLSYTIPHANNEAGRAFGNGMEVPCYEKYALEQWPEPQKGHAAMISRMDNDIGSILRKIRDCGIENNTIVFFTSDNGPHAEGGVDYNFFNSNGHLRGFKRDLYEGGIRVPLIVRWPGKIKPGSENGHICAFWDIFPTIMDISGNKVEYNADGISFLPSLLEDGIQEIHNHLYWEFSSHLGKQAVRLGKWKGIRLNTQNSSSMLFELYDLEKDPSETHNIAEEFPKMKKEILRIMDLEHDPSKVFPLFEWEF